MTGEEAREFYADPVHLTAAGPGRKRSAPRKTAMVAVRFDPAAIEAVKRLTDGTSQTVSGWIRDAVQREAGRGERKRPAGLTPGSGCRGERKALRSSLGWQPGATVTGSAGNGLTFRCEHLSIGNVESASCGACGPLSAVA